MSFITNIYVWMGATFLFAILFIILMIVLILLAKKTHAIIEFKAWIKKQPIALYFQENRYCEWKPVKPQCGIIEDKTYGNFLINEKATYIDKTTNNVLLPFDARFGVGINMKAAKLADDLGYIAKDEEQLKNLRIAIANNQIEESSTITALKTTINIGSLKSMLTSIIPHNIEAKINQIVASRLKNYGKINTQQVILVFVAIFGAILLGGLIVSIMLKK